MIFISYTAQGEATRLQMFFSRLVCFETNCKHCQRQEENEGKENSTSMANDHVVNVTQTKVSEGP